MGWAHNPVWTHTKHAPEEQKKFFEKLLTRLQNCDILNTNKGKDTLQTRKEFENEEIHLPDHQRRSDQLRI